MFQSDPHWRDLPPLLRVLPRRQRRRHRRSHQTGWTGTVATLLAMTDVLRADPARRRRSSTEPPRAPARPAPRSMRSTPRSSSSGLGHDRGRPLRLDEVPEARMGRARRAAVDAVWLMGVWQRSPGRPRDRAHRPRARRRQPRCPARPAPRGRHRVAVLRARLRRRRALRRAGRPRRGAGPRSPPAGSG
jgi:hypothetical protein